MLFVSAIGLSLGHSDTQTLSATYGFSLRHVATHSVPLQYGIVGSEQAEQTLFVASQYGVSPVQIVESVEQLQAHPLAHLMLPVTLPPLYIALQ